MDAGLGRVRSVPTIPDQMRTTMARLSDEQLIAMLNDLESDKAPPQNP
jgi:hypothetical protein